MKRQNLEAPQRRSDGLQIADYRSINRLHWIAERVAWVSFLALILAASAGFTGGGGSYSRNLHVTDIARLDLPAVSRWQSAETMSIRFQSPRPEHTIILGPEFIDLFSIDRIVPAPRSESMDARGLSLSVAAPGGQVTVSMRARRPGLARYGIVVDSADMAFRTLVLP